MVTARVALRCGGMQCGRATLQTRARVTRCSSMAYKRYAAQIGCLASAVHSAPPPSPTPAPADIAACFCSACCRTPTPTRPPGSAEGPWTFRGMVFNGSTASGASDWNQSRTNPGPLMMDDRSVRLYYRGGSKGYKAERIGMAVAREWAGPYAPQRTRTQTQTQTQTSGMLIYSVRCVLTLSGTRQRQARRSLRRTWRMSLRTEIVGGAITC